MRQGLRVSHPNILELTVGHRVANGRFQELLRKNSWDPADVQSSSQLESKQIM